MAKRQNTFLIKRSNVPGKVPSPGDLQLGELALNTADVILYASGTTSNQILPIGWDRLSTLSGGTVYGNVNVNGSISATTYLNLPKLSGDYLPLSGGTVYGNTYFTSGLTASTLTVNGLTQTYGITSTAGVTFKQVTINSTYSATTEDYMIDVTGGTFTVYLPSAVGIQGRLLVVKNNGGGAVTVQPTLGQNIDDKTFIILGETNSIQLISNGSNWVSLGYNISTVNSSTGVFEFTGITVASPTTFTVAPVKGWIVDDTTNPLSPQLFYVSYTGGTYSSTYVSSSTETWVYLTSGATISQLNIPLTEQQRRQNIFLGKLTHPSKTTIVEAFSQPDYVLSPLSQLRDMFTPINLVNGGIRPSANGVNLSFNTSAGYLYGLGINFVNDTLNPDTIYVSGTSPCTFQYRTQTGGTTSNVTVIDPTKYDVGGVVTSLSGTKATNQRIYLLQNGDVRVQYGQVFYTTLAQAVAGIATEQFVEFSNFTSDAILIGILSVLSTATDLSDTTKALFFNTSKFGDASGAAGGTPTTTLQQAYNNSINPEIITNSTLNGVQFRGGTGNDNDKNIVIESNSGTQTAWITASGESFFNSVSATTFYGDGSNLTGIPDYYVTGGTYSSGTLTLNRQNGSVTITGFTTGNGTFTGGTVTNLTASTIYTDYIDFNTGATVTQSQGRISWDSGTGTLNVAVGDSGTGLIDLQVGQEEIVRVYNSEATTLLQGEIVYVFGSQGNRPSVKRAIATNDGYSVTTLGMVSKDITSGSEGYVTTFGIISNLNTLGLTGGTPIFLSPDVAGGYTSTKPQAPNHIVLIGYVVRVNATTGSIFINISNGWELDEIHDVRISAATQGDLLMYSSYSGSPVWVNTKNLVGDYSINGSLSITGNSSNDVFNTYSIGGTKSLVVDSNGFVYNRGKGDISTNIVYGQTAFASNTSGSNNVAIGYNALRYNDTGSLNVSIGTNALTSNLSGSSNISIGTSTLVGNTIGNDNIAIGVSSLNANLSGSSNTALGSAALRVNIADNNTSVGYRSLYSNTTGTANSALGNSSLRINTTGSYNSSLGQSSLQLNTTGNNNIGIGYLGNYGNTTGSGNIGIGTSALGTSYTGSSNTAVGYETLRNNTSASNLTAVGYQALRANTIGSTLNAFGYRALYSNTVGTNNAAFGTESQSLLVSGSSNNSFGNYSLYKIAGNSSNNIGIGANAGYNSTSTSNSTLIGTNVAFSNITGSSNTIIGASAGYNILTDNNVIIGKSAGFSVTGSSNTIIGANTTLPAATTASLVLADGNGVIKLSADSAHHLFIPNSPSSGSTSDRILTRSTSGEIKEIDTTTLVLKTKSGVVTFTSFTGSPYTYDVVFVTPFTDALYSPQIIGYDSRSWTVSNVTSSGFRIETNSTTILTNNVYWTVTKHGEN